MLTQSLSAVGQAMYETAGAGAEGGAGGPEGAQGFSQEGAPGGETGGANGQEDEATVEGEFREVNDDKS